MNTRETHSAIDGLDPEWDKWNVRRYAAALAADLRILARLVQPLIAAPVAAGLAVSRFILQILCAIPYLLPHIPQELEATIGADEPLVRVVHFLPPCSALKDEKTKLPTLLYQVGERNSIHRQ